MGTIQVKWTEYLDALNKWTEDKTDTNWAECERLFIVWYKEEGQYE